MIEAAVSTKAWGVSIAADSSPKGPKDGISLLRKQRQPVANSSKSSQLVGALVVSVLIEVESESSEQVLQVIKSSQGLQIVKSSQASSTQVTASAHGGFN